MTWEELAAHGLSIVSDSEDMRSMPGTWLLIGNDHIVYAESNDLDEVVAEAKRMMGCGDD